MKRIVSLLPAVTEIAGVGVKVSIVVPASENHAPCNKR